MKKKIILATMMFALGFNLYAMDKPSGTEDASDTQVTCVSSEGALNNSSRLIDEETLALYRDQVSFGLGGFNNPNGIVHRHQPTWKELFFKGTMAIGLAGVFTYCLLRPSEVKQGAECFAGCLHKTSKEGREQHTYRICFQGGNSREICGNVWEVADGGIGWCFDKYVVSSYDECRLRYSNEVCADMWPVKKTDGKAGFCPEVHVELL